MEDRYYRKQPGSGELKKRLTSKGFIIGYAVAFPLIFYILFGSHGIVQRIGLENRISDLEEKVRLAEAENEELRAMSKALDSDMKAIEQVAREKYAMAKEGETVYRIKTENGTRLPANDVIRGQAGNAE